LQYSGFYIVNYYFICLNPKGWPFIIIILLLPLSNKVERDCWQQNNEFAIVPSTNGLIVPFPHHFHDQALTFHHISAK
jgi:hypothetical protein